MARKLTLVRTEAEWLIDLLESCNPLEEGTWRHDMASDIRNLFGILSREEEIKRVLFNKNEGKKQ